MAKETHVVSSNDDIGASCSTSLGYNGHEELQSSNKNTTGKFIRNYSVEVEEAILLPGST